MNLNTDYKILNDIDIMQSKIYKHSTLFVGRNKDESKSLKIWNKRL